MALPLDPLVSIVAAPLARVACQAVEWSTSVVARGGVGGGPLVPGRTELAAVQAAVDRAYRSAPWVYASPRIRARVLGELLRLRSGVPAALLQARLRACESSRALHERLLAELLSADGPWIATSAEHVMRADVAWCQRGDQVLVHAVDAVAPLRDGLRAVLAAVPRRAPVGAVAARVEEHVGGGSAPLAGRLLGSLVARGLLTFEAAAGTRGHAVEPRPHLDVHVPAVERARDAGWLEAVAACVAEQLDGGVAAPTCRLVAPPPRGDEDVATLRGLLLRLLAWGADEVAIALRCDAPFEVPEEGVAALRRAPPNVLLETHRDRTRIATLPARVTVTVRDGDASGAAAAAPRLAALAGALDGELVLVIDTDEPAAWALDRPVAASAPGRELRLLLGPGAGDPQRWVDLATSRRGDGGALGLLSLAAHVGCGGDARAAVVGPDGREAPGCLVSRGRSHPDQARSCEAALAPLLGAPLSLAGALPSPLRAAGPCA